MSIPITQELISSLKIAKAHKNHTKRITSIDIDCTGKKCVSVGEDETLNLFDCETGKHVKISYSKKYGIDLARFVNKTNCVVYASTKLDDSLRYLSLHDNQFIRYFQGHEKKVVSIDLNPVADQFLTGALDGTVRLWDVRTPKCTGRLECTGWPVVAFDPRGLIFAVGLNSNTIRLYDPTNFEKGPFSTWHVGDQQRPGVEWMSMKFSSDGDTILISTNSEVVYLLDAFQGTIKSQLTGFSNPLGTKIEASFTPDAQFVLSGSHDGKVHAWATETGTHFTLSDSCPTPVTCVRFNPAYMMMATACDQLAFWLPSS